MKRIDLENHFYDQCLIDAMRKRTNAPMYNLAEDTIEWTPSINMPQGELLDKLLDVSEKRFELMTSKGINHAVLSSAGGPELLDAENSIDVCKVTNDRLFTLTQHYQGHLFGSAVLPVKDINTAVNELERCVSDLGFVCWHTHSNYGDSTPDDPRYFPLFKKASELGIYVYLHPHLPASEKFGEYGFTFAGPGLGFTVDTMTTIMRMIVSGLFDELPDLKVVLGHLGEGLPFLLERIENRLAFMNNPAIKCQLPIHEYFRRNIWVTTSGNMSLPAFECAKEVLGTDQILFASDYPFESLDAMMHFLHGIPLSEDDYKKMYYKNAEKYLGISLND